MKIALTGGIGCGKTEALRIFKENGFRVVSSDDLVGRILAENATVKEAIVGHFSEGILDEKGEISRKKVAEEVFSDEAERLWLEGLIHPEVEKLRKKSFSEEPEAHWIAEIPLLFEKKLEKGFDFSVCISSNKGVAIERLKKRGMTNNDAEERILSQMPLSDKERKADFVIKNNESIDLLEKQILDLISELKKRA